jgi:hypothetical protein
MEDQRHAEIELQPSEEAPDDTLVLLASPGERPDTDEYEYVYRWFTAFPEKDGQVQRVDPQNTGVHDKALWKVSDVLPGTHTVKVEISRRSRRNPEEAPITFTGVKHLELRRPAEAVRRRPVAIDTSHVLRVELLRPGTKCTDDEVLWTNIRAGTDRLSFTSYGIFMDNLLARDQNGRSGLGAHLRSAIRLPFPGVETYRLLKAATEAFVMTRCGVTQNGTNWGQYLEEVQVITGDDSDTVGVLPYLAIIRRRLPDVAISSPAGGNGHADAEEIRLMEILRSKLENPCLIELIWAYWHEEAMVVQAVNALAERFQNRAAPGRRDPLANLELDPLRPINNLMWGYIQDEQHRLSVRRRAHEYLHHYGVTLEGKAVADVRPAEKRSKFLESFHNLLWKAIQFYRQSDETTVIADGFPVLNALKETHYLLAQGAHNQFGDLPATARQEMLIQQWLLSRPEIREFLGGRVMVPYPEPWMDRVDVLKGLKGWTDASVVHFHDLAVFGEQILLSVRFGAWSTVNDRTQAANWATAWRDQVQGYVHAYRAVTGVDLSADLTDQRQATDRYLPPSAHLRRRLEAQQA